VRCGGEEAIAKSQTDEQKPNPKACMGDKLESSGEVQKATVTHASKLGG